MNLSQLFFAAYVQYLAPPCRIFFTLKDTFWQVVFANQGAHGQADRQQMFQDSLKESWAPGKLDADTMVKGFDPLWTYTFRADTGDIFGIPPANEPGLGATPGYAFPGQTPGPGQKPYPSTAISSWLPCPTAAAMSAFHASTTPAEAQAWLAANFPPYKDPA
jgi:hypothetical protein